MTTPSSVEDFARMFAERADSSGHGYDDASRGLIVHREAEVSALLKEDRLWSRASADHRLAGLDPEHRAARQELSRFLALWPAFSGGPQHERMRAELVAGLGGPATAEAKRLLAEGVTTLDELAGDRFDLVADFAWPYALRIVGAVLDVRPEVAERLARLGARVLTTMAAVPSTVPDIRAALRAVDELQEWLSAAVAAPTSSELVAAAGQIWAATAALTQVVTGAVEPIVSSLCVLAERIGPHELHGLPVPVLREEVLRLATPFRLAIRYARCPLRVGEDTVSEGDRVVLHLGAANADPVAFPDPLAVREREAQHVAFGLGPHYCPGAGIARAAVDIVLAHLVERDMTFHCESVELAPEERTLRYRRLLCMLG
jgi:cytochrome P450